MAVCRSITVEGRKRYGLPLLLVQTSVEDIRVQQTRDARTLIMVAGGGVRFYASRV